MKIKLRLVPTNIKGCSYVQRRFFGFLWLDVLDYGLDPLYVDSNTDLKAIEEYLDQFDGNF